MLRRRLALALLLFPLPLLAAAPPKVVASIAPIHSLVAAVTGDVVEPLLLIPPGATPHSYSLRPSDARTLSEADLVVWVGESLERVLVKPMATLAGGARQLALMEAPGISRLPSRKGGAWAHPHGGAHDHGHEGHDEGADPHIWLSPANAKAVVDAVERVLVDMDPAHAAAYRENAERTRQRIEALEANLRGRLQPVRAHPYLVFHDAYHYFEAAFGLQPVGAVALDPDHPPGARRLAEIRAAVQGQGVRCVFSEPQFRSSLVESIVEGTDVRHGVLDPVGSTLSPGPELWFALMDDLGQSLIACLGGE